MSPSETPSATPLAKRAQAPPMATTLRGPAALTDLVTVLGGRYLRAGSDWCLWLTAEGDESSQKRFGVKDPPGELGWMVGKAVERHRDGDALALDSVLRAEEVNHGNWATPERLAFRCVAVRVELASLFAAGGALHGSGTPWSPPHPASPLLSAQRRSQAWAFLEVHLANACFPPTRILDYGTHVDLLYVLRPAWLDGGDARDRLRLLAENLCRFLHVANPRPLGAPIDVTRLLDVTKPVRCLLRIPTRARVWDPGLLLRDTQRLLHALAEANPRYRPGQATDPLFAMGLRTLPLTWNLSDFALEPHERAMLASTGGTLLPDVAALRAVVASLARRGHGWLDIEALALDPRYQLCSIVGMGHASLAGFKQEFRAALGERDARYAVRLPYGIIGLLKPPCPEAGERQRYLLQVREGEGLHEVTVDWDTLSSNAATARAIGKVLHRMPALAPQRFWRTALDLALIDPRVTRVAGPAYARAPKPLTVHIRDFVAGAREQSDILPSEGSASEWPMIRDGIVVFPRRVLEAYLASAGVVARRKELTMALESLGGGARGVMHFRGIGKLRVCFAPILASL